MQLKEWSKEDVIDCFINHLENNNILKNIMTKEEVKEKLNNVIKKFY